MIQNVSEKQIKENGWSNYDIERGNVVLYCMTCKSQRLHYCNGRKKIVSGDILRFVCGTCDQKLNGNRWKGNGRKQHVNGTVFKTSQRTYSKS